MFSYLYWEKGHIGIFQADSEKVTWMHSTFVSDLQEVQTKTTRGVEAGA